MTMNELLGHLKQRLWDVKGFLPDDEADAFRNEGYIEAIEEIIEMIEKDQ